MSEFTSHGSEPFPSTYFDNRDIGNCSEWSDERIEGMVTEYWQFMDRKDLQPRARAIGERVLAHLGFEMDYRYGAYETLPRLEDEVCEAA